MAALRARSVLARRGIHGDTLLGRETWAPKKWRAASRFVTVRSKYVGFIMACLTEARVGDMLTDVPAHTHADGA
jgi:hypothetical protein